ncbi:MAG TPA: DUF533 domain-containing protein [Xanthobacteraceae bacterium]|nr:DUF533 domain-containing protein [Xanthobacteraceae bacterium]
MFDTRNFDAKRLLDQFLGPQGAGPGASVPQPWQGGRAPAGGADDLMSRAKGFLGGQGGSLAGGAAAGALVSLVLGSKGGRKIAKNAVTFGGLALVGTLAYKAYQNYQSGAAPAEAAVPLPASAPAQLPPPDSPFAESQSAKGTLPRTLLRVMIAAALADGHLDAAERTAITAELNARRDGGLSDAERFLTDEIANPASVETIAREVASPEEAAEVYMAALLAIDPDSASERAFLARLALALKLDAALTPHLEAAARAARG